MGKSQGKSLDPLSRARAALEGGQEQIALEAVDALLAAEPDHAQARALRGRALLALDRLDEARDELLRAATARPPALPALLDLGWLALGDAEPDQAADRAEQVLELGREEAERLEALTLWLRAGDALGVEPAEVEAQATRVAELLGRDAPLAALAEGRALFHRGRFEEALPLLRRAAEGHEGWALAAWWYGVALERVGRIEEGDRWLAQAVEEDSLGASYELPVRLDDAEFDAVVEEALETLPEVVRAKLAAHCLVERRDYPEPSWVREHGVDPFLLGLCLGEADDHLRGHGAESPLSDLGAGPVGVLLYRRNLERWCTSREELLEEVRITLFHEVGHALGLDEDEVDALGLG